MKLRNQLILAFFLLAVLPLSAITVYSYTSSTRALRRAVESESTRTAEEMERRMTAVTASLSERIGHLREIPFPEVRSGKIQAATPPDPATLHRLVGALGDVADFVDAFELTPAASPSPPASPGRAPGRKAPAASAPAPPAPPIVIKLGDALKQIAPGSDLEKVIENAVALVPPEEQEKIPKSVKIEIEARARAFAEALQRRIAAARKGEAAPGATSTAMMHGPHLVFKNEFACSLERDGATVGHLKARVSSERLLGAVLSETRREQGEIPFARDADGHLYTPDPADYARLDEIGLAAADPVAAAAAGTGSMAPAGSRAAPAGATGRARDRWVVVTHEDAATGVAFGIARPVGASLEAIRSAAARNLAAGLGLAVLAFAGIAPLTRRMTRDLDGLNQAAGRLARGDLGARVPVRSHNEVGRLAETFNRMAADLETQQQRLLEQERLRKELELCRKIQMELLPREALRCGFAEARAISIPARELGGDFFNYFPLADSGVALLMGDVSGKGVPAALLMANLQATLQARLPLEHDLAAFAGRLDREVEASTPSEHYVTLFLGVLDPARRELRYVNAGHEAPLLRRGDGRIERLEPTGRPIGLLPGGGYAERRVPLAPGDRLVLYTDGLVEAENEAGESFGAARLEALLRGETAAGVPPAIGAPAHGADDGDPGSTLARLERACAAHRGRVDLADDATMLVLRVGDWRAPAGAASDGALLRQVAPPPPPAMPQV
jgi:HAMP domain-containing protein